MSLVILAFLAGAFTVLAPCVVSIIPILLARTATSSRYARSLRVIAGLSLSIIVFSLLLKSSTLLIDVPTYFWSILSGAIILLFGLVTIFPKLWENLSLRTGIATSSQKGLSKATAKGGVWGDFLIGASFGPIFSACSPTYALIVASILPASPIEGLGYLLAFVLGLGIMLFMISVFGQKLISRLGWGINPNGIFRKALGIVLIVVGVFIVTGLDKTLLSYLVQSGFYDFQIFIESTLN